MPALNLPGVLLAQQDVHEEGGSWRHQFVLQLPERSRFLQLIIPRENELRQAWIDGQLALDKRLQSKNESPADSLRLVYPGEGPVVIELLTASPDTISLSALSWHDLPAVLTAPFMGNWPDNAQPLQYGPRAVKIQHIELQAAGAD